MISVNALNKYYGEKQILKDISFNIFDGEKVAIVGPNGAGKTTLFKILTNELDYESGTVDITKGQSVGIIDQMPNFSAGSTVEDVLRLAFKKIDELKVKLENISHMLSENPSDEKLINDYGKISHQIEQIDGYNVDFKVDKVANGLLIDDEMRKKQFSILSGGEKTRVNLARIILEDTDILLLDEPTNHLDMAAINWLGEYLETYKGTVVMISHDRYFLDQAAQRIIEINAGVCDFYEGSYSFYAVEREKRYEMQLTMHEREYEERQKLIEASRKMHQWGTEKMHKRASSMDKKIEKMKVTDRPKREKHMRVSFGQADYETIELLKVKELSHSFDDRKVINNLSFELRNGDRLAIIGENGTGKTTLLKILLGIDKVMEGKINRGDGLKPAYLPQIVNFENTRRNLIDTLIYEKNVSAQTARNRLGSFHFSGEDQLKIVENLSGGEKSRLKLSTMMYDEINLLVLDEPTNHLDIISREWIEEAVEGFEGTIMFVSHDRYFISRFANRILELTRDGYTYFEGTYEQFLKIKENTAVSPVKTKVEHKEKPKIVTKQNKNNAKKIVILEREIGKLEEELLKYDDKINEVASDASKLMEVMKEKAEIENQIEEKMLLWAELED